MVELTPQDILKLARLARIQVTEDELQKYSKELTAILEYVEQLKDVDTTGLTPTYQVTGLTDIMRADELIDYGATTEELLKNAPATDSGHIKVKRMIG
jgi:aspartyl-tRNA(Asn)/glutamyl-tRNA(Gln) amidotransferase subunit C